MKPMFIKMPADCPVFFHPNGLHKVVYIEKTGSYKGYRLGVKTKNKKSYLNTVSWFEEAGCTILYDTEVYIGIAAMSMVLIGAAVICYLLW